MKTRLRRRRKSVLVRGNDMRERRVCKSLRNWTHLRDQGREGLSSSLVDSQAPTFSAHAIAVSDGNRAPGTVLGSLALELAWPELLTGKRLHMMATWQHSGITDLKCR